MLKIKTRNLNILYNKIKDLYRLEFLGYNTIVVFISLLAYISPSIFLYHFLGNQTDFSTQLISIFYGFRFDFLTKIIAINIFHQVVTIIWRIVYIFDGFDRCGFDERLGLLDLKPSLVPCALLFHFFFQPLLRQLGFPPSHCLIFFTFLFLFIARILQIKACLFYFIFWIWLFDWFTIFQFCMYCI